MWILVDGEGYFQRKESQARGCRGIPYGVSHWLQYGDLAGREAPRQKKKSIYCQGKKMTFQEKEESPFSSNSNNLCKGLSPDKEELERKKALPWRSPFPQRKRRVNWMRSPSFLIGRSGEYLWKQHQRLWTGTLSLFPVSSGTEFWSSYPDTWNDPVALYHATTSMTVRRKLPSHSETWALPFLNFNFLKLW